MSNQKFCTVTKVSFPATYKGIKGTAKDITEIKIGKFNQSTVTFFPNKATPFMQKIVSINDIDF